MLAVLHDLNLALAADRLLVLHQGRLVADGPPARVLRPLVMAEVFGVEGHFAQTPDGPVFQPTRTLP